MKKIILAGSIIIIANAGVFKVSKFKKYISHVPVTKIQKTFRTISTSKTLKIVKKELGKQALNAKEQLIKIASNIAKKSKFANKMMGSKDPLYAMKLYARYGDTFYKKADILTTKVVNINPTVITKIEKKFPNARIVKMDENQAVNRFIDVMKATGNVGVKVTKGLGDFALKYPGSAVAGVLYGWYLTDPKGFVKEMNKFGNSIEGFATEMGKIISKSVVGAGEGFFEGLAQNITIKEVLFGVVSLLLFFLWKFRDVISGFKTEKKEIKISKKAKNNRKKGGF